MRVNFVTLADETMASFRYHNQIPARELSKLGHKATISTYPDFEICDVHVFSKHLNYGDLWYMNSVKSPNTRTAFHCCDNHFVTKHADHYKRMIRCADTVLCTTPEMQAEIARHTGKKSTVIPDTYELDEQGPRYQPCGKLKLLWYGHPSNLQDLIDVLPEIKEHELRICTFPLKPWPSKLIGYQIMPYSSDNILRALDWCDAVIIPSSCDERKRVKSANRLMEAVRRGKFVIANPLPSYGEYSDFMRIGNIKEGIDWLQEQSPIEIEERIFDAQQYMKSFYSPSIIGELWAKALSS